MEKTLSVILILLSLFLGIIGGAVFAHDVEIKEVEVEKIVEVPLEVEVLVEVPSAEAFLNAAVVDFMKHVDDKEIFECGSDEYNFNEISISRVYDRFELEFDDEDYLVNFKIKLEYDEDDEKSCYETFNVEAYYEESEDVEFSLN